MAAVLVALTALAGTVVVSTRLRSNDAGTAEQTFQGQSNAAVSVAKQEIGRYTDALHAAGAFYNNAGTVDPAAMRGYVASSDVFGHLPTVTSLIFARRVAEADVDALMADLRVHEPGIQLLDLGGHIPGTDRWIITTYIAGARDFHIPAGIDVSSLPGLGDQTQRVALTGRSVAASFKLSPELDEIARTLLVGTDPDVLNSEFFLEVPSWTGARGTDGRPPDGMVIAAVRGFAETVATTANLQFDDLGFSLTVDLDGLGISAGSSQVARLDGQGGSPDDAAFSTSTPFEVDGIDWTLSAWRGPRADDRSAVPWLVLALGTVCSLLLGSAIYFRTRWVERARLLRDARAQQARFQEDIVQSVAEAMVVIDHDGTIAVGNRAWSTLVGMPAAEHERYLDVLGRRTTEPIDRLAAAIGAALAGDVAEAEVVDVPLTAGDTTRWFAIRATSVREGEGGAVVVHSDVTDRRLEQDSLAERARRDPLTGLANRDAFALGFEQAMAEGRPVALLYIDLDRFKQINDNHGHRVGDDVLVSVAVRIRGAARNDDVIARLGGDEFALLVRVADAGEATAIARRIEANVAQPLMAGDTTVTPQASVGIALVDPAAGESLEHALERADRAMYAAKHDAGRRSGTAAR